VYRDVVGFKLAVRVRQDTVQVGVQLHGPTRIRAEVDASLVVVVRVNVVPDDGFALQHLAQLLNRFFCDDFRNDFVTGPHDIDIGIQFITERVEIFGLLDTRYRTCFAVFFLQFCSSAIACG
jgi:hypothetical protein